MSSAGRRPVTLGEHFLAAGIWGLSGGAGLIALQFAYRVKPHVLFQTALAYALVWALLAYFAVVRRRLGRRLFSFNIWLIAICFCAFLCFIHLDDVPARLVYRDDPPAGPRMWLRPDAPSLYWGVGCNIGWALLFTVRIVWRGLRGERDRRDQRDQPPAVSRPVSAAGDQVRVRGIRD